MILLETTQSRHVFCSLSAILAIGGDDSMASRAAHLGLGNIPGSLAMLAATRRVGTARPTLLLVSRLQSFLDTSDKVVLIEWLV